MTAEDCSPRAPKSWSFRTAQGPMTEVEREVMTRRYSNAVVRILPLADGTWAVMANDCEPLLVGALPDDDELRRISVEAEARLTRRPEAPSPAVAKSLDELGL